MPPNFIEKKKKRKEKEKDISFRWNNLILVKTDFRNSSILTIKKKFSPIGEK